MKSQVDTELTQMWQHKMKGDVVQWLASHTFEGCSSGVSSNPIKAPIVSITVRMKKGHFPIDIMSMTSRFKAWKSYY